MPRSPSTAHPDEAEGDEQAGRRLGNWSDGEATIPRFIRDEITIEHYLRQTSLDIDG